MYQCHGLAFWRSVSITPFSLIQNIDRSVNNEAPEEEGYQCEDGKADIHTNFLTWFETFVVDKFNNLAVYGFALGYQQLIRISLGNASHITIRNTAWPTSRSNGWSVIEAIVWRHTWRISTYLWHFYQINLLFLMFINSKNQFFLRFFIH